MCNIHSFSAYNKFFYFFLFFATSDLIVILMVLSFVLILSFGLFSLFIAVADIRTGMVPRAAFIVAFPVFIILKSLLTSNISLLVSIGGSFLGLSVFLLAYYFSGKKLGLADVWYSALIGFVLGPLWWYAAIGLACILGLLYILFSKRHQIPFTPLMALGSVAVGLFQGLKK